MSDDIAVKVSHVSKSFKLPLEAQNSIKGKLINFTKRGYEIQHALKGISFEVKKGEFFGIVGRNGSGKSTLLKLMSGIYSQDAGEINTVGKLIPFIELGVGFNPELSGRDNVFLNGALLGFSRKQMEELYESIVEFAEIERFMDQKLKNYSSGMQVRLAFSIAIRAQADVLILDEVLAVGDAAFQQKCFDYFQNLKEQGKTVVLVTHDMDSVRRFCDRALMIADGEIKIIGTPQEVSDMYLEANIQRDTSDDQSLEGNGNLKVKLDSPEAITQGEPVELVITYELEEKTDHYLGISIHNNGISFAEQNTKKALDISPESGHKVVTIKVESDYLNGGRYDVGVAVFDKKTGALMFFKTRAVSFAVKGKDDTVGGPMKLTTTWKEKHHS